MKDNKLLVTLVIVFFVIFICVCGVAVYQEIRLENEITNKESNQNKEENTNVEKIYEVYDVNDSLVLELIAPVNIIPMLDDEELLTTLYGVSRTVNVSDLTDNQKLYLSLRYYMNSNNIKVDTCDYGDSYVVNLDDLRTSYVKDDGYLENIKDTTEHINVGEYMYATVDDGFDVCHSIYGFEGPLRVTHDLEVVSAYREDNKMYINTKLIRYENVPGKESKDDYFYYDTYDSYSENALVIENFEEGLDGSGFKPDLSKYSTYQFVYEVDGEHYYLETINRK